MADQSYSDEELEQLMSVNPGAAQSTDPAGPTIDPSTLQSIDPSMVPVQQNASMPGSSTPPDYMTDPYGLGGLTSVGGQTVQTAPVPVAVPVAPPAAVPTTAPTPAPRVVVKPAPATSSVPAAPAAANPAMSNEAYTEAAVGNLNEQQDITRQQGEAAQKAGDDLYYKNNQAADESLQRATDFKNYFKELSAKHDEDAKRINLAYNDYAAKAGSLKDPTKQYYSDHGGFAAQLAAGVASFASGLGAGILGHAGVPFLDYLNNHINANFEAHKQNIKDLYDKQVAAGKIADTNQNWAMYSSEAKLKAYELDAAHITHELQSIKDRAVGQQAKFTADLGIKGLQQQSFKLRNELAEKQAAILAKRKAEARAAAAAQQAKLEAEQKEARSVFVKAREDAIKEGMSPEDATVIGASAVQDAGFSRHAASPTLSASGGSFDPKTDRWKFPGVTGVSGGGKLSITLPDGSVVAAKTKDDADEAKQKIQSQQELQDHLNILKQAKKEIEETGGIEKDTYSKWMTTRSKAIPSFNSAKTGKAMQTPEGEVKALEHGIFKEPPTAILPTWAPGGGNVSAFQGNLNDLNASIDGLEQYLHTARQGLQNNLKSGNVSPESKETKPVDDKTKVKKIAFTKG